MGNSRSAILLCLLLPVLGSALDEKTSGDKSKNPSYQVTIEATNSESERVSINLSGQEFEQLLKEGSRSSDPFPNVQRDTSIYCEKSERVSKSQRIKQMPFKLSTPKSWKKERKGNAHISNYYFGRQKGFKADEAPAILKLLNQNFLVEMAGASGFEKVKMLCEIALASANEVYRACEHFDYEEGYAYFESLVKTEDYGDVQPPQFAYSWHLYHPDRLEMYHLTFQTPVGHPNPEDELAIGLEVFNSICMKKVRSKPRSERNSSVRRF